MRSVTINVTQSEIDRGYPSDCYACPVALAIQSIFQFAKVVVDVDLKWVRLSIPLVKISQVQIILPKEVTEQIKGFDNGRGMTPFSFTFDVPDQFESLLI